MRIYLSMLLACLFAVASVTAQTPKNTPAAAARMAAEATRVTITRDDWGIAHIHGHTDADAIFGMIYAQAEDDFPRIERNYLTALGRTAEADGESAIWQDLRQRLFIDPEDLKADYAKSPAWLRVLMDAWADGLNFYLASHPEIKPLVLTHFEPWMALSFTEGSIGGDIEKIDLAKLRAFYESACNTRPCFSPTHASSASRRHPEQTLSAFRRHPEQNISALRRHPERSEGPLSSEPSQVSADAPDAEPGGSNGFVISPALTLNHHALLLINPHTSFFFRSELQVTSDEGLNAYGAATWGQLFIYQGFNERAGWMHTSSNVDAVDEFLLTSLAKDANAKPIYYFAGKPVYYDYKSVSLIYKTSTGSKTRTFTTYSSQHGPATRSSGDGRWIATALMNKPIEALEQSFLRTKAHTYAEYAKTMELFANSSNNTVFADSAGDIAYWHGNFIPRRDLRFDYTKPVDGADPATAWHGLLTLDEVPHLLNPASGFLFNVNDSPWNGAGASSLKQADYPAYVEQGIETARGVHAANVLGTRDKPFTLDSLLAAAYDRSLPWFASTIPALLKAYDTLPGEVALKQRLAPSIALLRRWDDRWSLDSTATSLAVFWGTELMKTEAQPAREARVPSEQWVATHTAPGVLLGSLATAGERLGADFGAVSGSVAIPWGQINRYQRLTAEITQPFSDASPSIPVPFTSSLWGSLASFAARPYFGTKRWYGTAGNSFVAVVEFGPRVHARAVTAGGESGHPASAHFNDEAQRYATGNLRDVYFYPEDLKPHTERTYHPGN